MTLRSHGMTSAGFCATLASSFIIKLGKDNSGRGQNRAASDPFPNLLRNSIGISQKISLFELPNCAIRKRRNAKLLNGEQNYHRFDAGPPSLLPLTQHGKRESGPPLPAPIGRGDRYDPQNRYESRCGRRGSAKRG